MREQLGKLLGLIDGEAEGDKIKHVEIALIGPGKYQPRTEFSTESLDELAASIKTYGVLQPVLLRKRQEGYELIAGERRYRAAKIAGLTHVPAIIKNLTEDNAAMIAVIENVQRQDLNFVEEAQSYRRLIGEFSMSQDELAAKIGKSQPTIANKLRLLQIPEEILHSMVACGLTERHARAILKLKAQELQREVVEKIIKDKMNVRQTEDLVESKINIPREIEGEPGKKDKPRKAENIEEVAKTFNINRNTQCIRYLIEMDKLNRSMMAAGMDIKSKINDNEDGSIKITMHIKIAAEAPVQGVD